MISRIRQRWAQSAPDRFVTLQPLPSSLTRALDSASPNPCSASTGSSSDPVAPVPCQLAPLQVAIHPSWPSVWRCRSCARSSGSSACARSGVPLAGWLLCSQVPSAALQCGPYAPVGPVSASLSAPVAAGGSCRPSRGPAVLFICSAWPAGFLSGRPCVGWPSAPFADHCTWPNSDVSVCGVSALRL